MLRGRTPSGRVAGPRRPDRPSAVGAGATPGPAVFTGTLSPSGAPTDPLTHQTDPLWTSKEQSSGRKAPAPGGVGMDVSGVRPTSAGALRNLGGCGSGGFLFRRRFGRCGFGRRSLGRHGFNISARRLSRHRLRLGLRLHRSSWVSWLLQRGLCLFDRLRLLGIGLPPRRRERADVRLFYRRYAALDLQAAALRRSTSSWLVRPFSFAMS